MRANYFLILFTLFIGSLLTICPLPKTMVWFWPQWMFAILIFWVIASPLQCGVLLAFFAGLWMDMLTGTALGQHASVFVLMSYIVLKSHSAVVHFPLVQQGLFVGIFVAIGVLLQGFILHLTGHTAYIALGMLSALTTFLIWPLLCAALNKLRPRALIR